MHFQGGEFWGIMGVNGVGKTSLIKSIQEKSDVKVSFFKFKKILQALFSFCKVKFFRYLKESVLAVQLCSSQKSL